MSVPVVLVAGLHGPARAVVVDRVLRERPGAVAIHHDLGEVKAGIVVRTVRTAGVVSEHTVIRLEHGCVSCTVRHDLIPELLRHASSAPLLVADLWDSVEPRMVAEALASPRCDGTVRLTAVLTALDAELTPLDICRGELLAEAGRPGAAGDQRYLAEVMARQIEYATTLVLPEVLPAPLPPVEADDLDLCREVLGHLAPLTPVVLPGEPLPPLTGPALCSHELAARVDPGTAQLPCTLHGEAVDTVEWRRTAPLHPTRFFDAVDGLASESVRSRGRFWLANRPERMLAWDAVAGVVTVEDAGPWLAAMPVADWASVPTARRLAAALDWSPGHGDRVQHLVFTGPDLEFDRIHTLLDSCLLGPEETVTDSDDPFSELLDLEETT